MIELLSGFVLLIERKGAFENLLPLFLVLGFSSIFAAAYFFYKKVR